jgi:tetratricopeptide (TPR) repeat protein
MNDNNKVFLVINGGDLSLVEMIVSDLCSHQQLEVIYIFCSADNETADNHRLSERYRKVKIVSSRIKFICDQLKQDIKQYENNLVSFHLFGASSVTDDSCLPKTENMNYQDVAFMYSQLFKEIVTQMEYSDSDKQEMIDYCRFQYSHDLHQLELINEFDKNYQSHSPVWWYTRPGFLYKMLNGALYKQDIDTLYAMRVFIKDLHQQLVQLHINANHDTGILTLYRGLRLTTVELKKLKNSQGGLYSISNFLSTTIDRRVASIFAGDLSDNNSHVAPVLFKIEVDLSSIPPTAAFASIDALSYFQGVEQEYLFSIGSVFRIGVTELPSVDGVWCVHLTLTGDSDPHLTSLTEHMRKQMGGGRSLSTLGRLIFHMGDFEKSKQVCQAALISEINAKESAILHNNLAMSYKKLGDLDTALLIYKHALEIEQEYLPEEDSFIAATLSNISTIHLQRGHFDLALEYAQRSLSINLRVRPINHENLSIAYDCLGSIRYGQGKILEALENYERALAIRVEGMPPTHSHTAASHNNIGFIYAKQGRHEEALMKFQKCLEMELTSLPVNHPSIANSHHNIGCTLHELGKHQEALEHCHRAVQISTKTYGSEHAQTRQHQKKLDYISNQINCQVFNIPLD